MKVLGITKKKTNGTLFPLFPESSQSVYGKRFEGSEVAEFMDFLFYFADPKVMK